MSTLSRLLAAPGTPDRPTPTQGLSGVFEEEPVPLEVFVTGKRYLNNPPLSPIQYDAVRHIEQIYLPETYPLMAEEFGDYWLPKRSINFATLQWGKGSTDPDSLVYSAVTGQWKRLRDWLAGDRVASHDLSTGEVSSQPTSEGFIEATGQMYEVTTKRGLKMRVWEGHRFLTWNRRRWPSGQRVARFKEAQGAGWARLWDLVPGDPIAVATSVPEPLSTVRMPEHEVEYLAFLIANGSCTGSNHGIFTCGDHALLTRARARECVGQFPDTQMQEEFDTSGGSTRWRCKPVQPGTRSYSWSVRDFVEKYGLDKTAHFKDIPEEVFRLPNDQVALFLSRLIDTDGWVSISNTAEIGYGTMSRALAESVQRLALRLGVAMSITEAKAENQIPDYEGIRYTVRVRDAEMVERLASQLRLLDKEPFRVAALEWASQITKRRALFGDIVWDRIETIEPLGEGEYWSLTEPLNANYVANGGFVNRNSGKDHICRVSSLRIAYLLLCLKSPQDYFSMPAQDIIHMLNVASNRSQAYQAFFKPMTKVVQTSGAWFEDKCQVRQDTIVWDKNVEMISGHADAESQEGLNLILGIADEIDAFKTKDELLQYRPNQNREPTKSAEAILKMIRTSASTRFPESYKVVTISYPRYLGSMIQVLTRDGQRSLARDPDGSREYVSGPHATWEVNPRVRGQEQFSKDYEDDPVMARTMYECKPARAVDPYFRNVDAVKAVFRQDSPLEVGYTLEDMGGSRIWKPEYVFDASLVPMQGANYVIHADLAIKGDRAGLAMSHVQSWTEVQDSTLGEDGEVRHFNELRPVVKVDFAFGYSADLRSDPAREIQIRWVRLLVAELRKRGFVISRVTFDQFQSSDSMQILEATGIPTQRVSVDRDETAWRTLRDLIYEGRISLPASALLEDELLGLKKLLNGKIDHPALGSKDVADAVAGSVLGALEEGGQENGLRSYGDSGAFSTFGLGQRPEFSRGLRGLEKPIMFR